MRRFLLMIVGLILLVAAAVLLWMSHGPQSKQQRTTGGVLYSQQEVAQAMAAQGSTTTAPNLGAVVDLQTGGAPATVPLQPEINQAAVAHISEVPANQGASAPTTIAEAGVSPAPQVPLTTDIVLNNTTQVQVAPISTSSSPVGPGQGGSSGTAAGYEQRVVNLEWPKKFQVGRGGSVRIKLRVLSGGALQPVAEVAGNEVLATPILITDRYDTYNAFVTATLSAPDFDIQSVTPSRQAMERGSEPEWRWTLTASNSNSSIISLGLMIAWEPKPGQGGSPLANVPIWGQTVQVEVDYVFGLITVPQASTAGTVLAVVGFVSQIPMIDTIIQFFWGVFKYFWRLFFGPRRRKQDSSRRR